MSEYKLTEEIIKLSQSKLWDVAKSEWTLYEIYEADKPERCLCGHFPIIEICNLKNKLNLDLFEDNSKELLMAQQIIENGLKNKLNEIWGIEENLYFPNNKFINELTIRPLQ